MVVIVVMVMTTGSGSRAGVACQSLYLRYFAAFKSPEYFAAFKSPEYFACTHPEHLLHW